MVKPYIIAALEFEVKELDYVIARFQQEHSRILAAKIITSQHYRNDDIIQKKRDAEDYDVFISPEFENCPFDWLRL